ncbi:hypothetical protein LSAT2_030739 [Lamellibrachia satsuma]|nr:hypothetical protein LSAT2_030739 [Lamellibrachia satsuma]
MWLRGSATVSTTTLILLLTVESLCLARKKHGGLCVFGRDRDCLHPCRCTRGCDRLTGGCLRGGTCQDGAPLGYHWRGVACATGNVAYHKVALQRTTSVNEYGAHLAVVGNVDPQMGAMHCALATGAGREKAWWWLDLADTYVIYSGTVHGSIDDAASLSQFAVYYCPTGATSCVLCGRHRGEVAPGGKATVRCRQDSVGHYVRFESEVMTTPSIATLCEVVVIGRSYNRKYHVITSMTSHLHRCNNTHRTLLLVHCTIAASRLPIASSPL